MKQQEQIMDAEELFRYFTQQLSHWKMFDGNAEAEAKVSIAKAVLAILSERREMLAKLEAAQRLRDAVSACRDAMPATGFYGSVAYDIAAALAAFDKEPE